MSAKGGNWEREVAKTLTKWLTGKEKPYVWWRTPGSGAMATISNENKEISGDIISLRPEGAFLTDRFSIECKVGYPNSSFHKHLKGVKNDEIRDFWKQCVRDAERASKMPMLIYKKKLYNSLIGISPCLFINKVSSLQSMTLHYLDGDLPSVKFYDFEEFLNAISPNDVRQV